MASKISHIASKPCHILCKIVKCQATQVIFASKTSHFACKPGHIGKKLASVQAKIYIFKENLVILQANLIIYFFAKLIKLQVTLVIF